MGVEALFDAEEGLVESRVVDDGGLLVALVHFLLQDGKRGVQGLQSAGVEAERVVVNAVDDALVVGLH